MGVSFFSIPFSFPKQTKKKKLILYEHSDFKERFLLFVGMGE